MDDEDEGEEEEGGDPTDADNYLPENEYAGPGQGDDSDSDDSPNQFQDLQAQWKESLGSYLRQQGDQGLIDEGTAIAGARLHFGSAVDGNTPAFKKLVRAERLDMSAAAALNFDGDGDGDRQVLPIGLGLVSVGLVLDACLLQMVMEGKQERMHCL